MNMEQITGLIVCSTFAFPGIVFGLVLCAGHGADLIAGYNSLPAAERANWNEKALCRATGIFLLLMVGCIELTGAGAVLGEETLTWGSFALIIVLTVAYLIYINKSRRFKRGNSENV